MDRRTLIRIAQLYYSDGITQQKIARLMGLSRVTVNAALKKAREDGIVTIHVLADDVCSVPTLEAGLKRRFALQKAVVVACPSDAEDLVRQHVGMAGARFLEGALRDGNTLACSWGRTLRELVRVIKPGQRRINVVQLNGGLGQVFDASMPNELARDLAQIYGGQYYYLHAPGIVENARVREALLSESSIRETLARASAADIAACGIGSLIDSSLVEFGCIDEKLAERLRAAGVVGDICLRFFGRDGRMRHTELDDRIIGLTAEELKKIPCVVGISGGLSKRDAFLGALRSGLLDVCVTDAWSAEYVLNDYMQCL